MITNKSDRGGGTGFHIEAKSGKTYILTNKHICDMADKTQELHVHYFKDGKKQKAVRKIIKKHKSHDLCLMQPLDHLKKKGLILRGEDIYIGKTMYIYGHPGLRPLTFSQGEFIGKTDIHLFKLNIKKEECDGEWYKTRENTLFWHLGMRSVCKYKRSAYQITNIIYGGNSGSPVTDFLGRCSWSGLCRQSFSYN
jgi:hypothetical protein